MRRNTLRKMIVLVELLVLVAAVMMWRERPVAPVIPLNQNTKKHYVIEIDEEGVYLVHPTVWIFTEEVRLLQFRTDMSCKAELRLDNGLSLPLNGLRNLFPGTTIFDFSARNIQIVHPGSTENVVLKFDDSSLTIENTDCYYSGDDGG